MNAEDDSASSMNVDDDLVKHSVGGTETHVTEPLMDSNGRSKRVRKTKVRLEEEDAYLKDALGLNKKKRAKKESNEVGMFQNANANVSLKRYKPKKVDETKRMSANAIAMKELEKLSDMSLKYHLPVLRYFLTPKVIERIESAESFPQVTCIGETSGDTTIDFPPKANESSADVNDSLSSGDTSYINSTTNEGDCSVDNKLPLNGDPLAVTEGPSASVNMTSSDVDTPHEVSENNVIPHSNGTSNVKSAAAINSTSNMSIDVVGKQPKSLTNVKMRPYQIEGLQWLVEHYQRGINCILADEMGLGKTLQTISYFAYLKDNKLSQVGPHLVVVPLSVLFNWVAEMKKFCPTLRILRLHTNNSSESARLRDVINAADSYDVLITTYEMIKGAMEVTMRRILWSSMVLDEGHRIKNSETMISKTCKLFKARHKIILTGTPVQNNLHETFCLLNFLHPNVFDHSEKFDDCFSFDNSGQISVDRQVLDKAHYMLRPFVLRRVKSEVEDRLPPKVETLIECPMSSMQRFWSKRLLLKNSNLMMQLEEVAEGSTNNADERDVTEKDDSGSWKKLQSLLAQLRKAANHPYLFPDAEHISDDPDALSTNEDIVTASGKMVILDQLLKKLKRKGHRVVLFSQYTKTLDIISDYLDYRGYSYSRLDGQTNRVYREVLINQFNRKKSSKFIFCLSTRAGGEGVNLYTADTVILFDSDWNPQVDIQAMARVHRIGQTKTVHIYRLVTAGTVEERIVQRAQKKLFLDSVVNRGSTSKALELDELREESKADGTNAETGDDDVSMSAMMSALKFGWNSCFSFNENDDNLEYEENIKFSDEVLNSIIDRKRGLDKAVCLNGVGSENAAPVQHIATSKVSIEQKSNHINNSNSKDDKKKKAKVVEASIRENQQMSADLFEESAPMVGLRQLGNEVIGTSAGPSNKMKDIAEAWSSRVTGKRQSKTRMESVVVEGVGRVNVLKSNQYTLEGGEPSVFESEAKGKDNEWAKEKKKKSQPFINQDHCQVCFDYGDLLLCQHCPAAYHLACCGLRKVPPGQWSCPHHQGCVTCLRSCGAIGFTFRCEACANSYCEDCVPPDVDFLEHVERWDDLGFKYPRNCCYIRCSKSCKTYMLGREKEARAAAAKLKKEKRQQPPQLLA